MDQEQNKEQSINGGDAVQPQPIQPDAQPVTDVQPPAPLQQPTQDVQPTEQPPVASAPVTQPETTAASPQPSVENLAQPETQTGQAGDAPAGKPKKKLILLAIPILLALTAAGVFIALQVFGGGLKLATHNGTGYSIKYPEGYEQEVDGNTIAFMEPGGEDDETRSGVVVATEDLPAELTDEQRNLLKEQLPAQIDAFVDNAATSGEHELKNREVDEDAKIGNDPARRVSVDVYKGDSKVGDFYILAGVTNKKLVLVAVMAHTSDPLVEDKAAEILESFTLTD